MKSSLPVVAALAVAGVAVPVVAEAGHKPGHGGGGQGGAALTIAAAPKTTVYRGATVITGRLKGRNNAGVTVTLRRDEFPYGSGVATSGTARTDGNGSYTFTRRPVRNTAYQAVAGTTTSAAVVVAVRIKVGLRVSDATPRRGQVVRFRGRACPAHDGRRVSIQRRTRTGSYRTVRRTRLRAATRCSTYRRSMRVYRDGTYRTTVDDADHARGYSRTRRIDVHR